MTVKQQARIIIRAAKKVYRRRNELPRYLQCLLAVTTFVKLITTPLPIDFGIDEVLMVVTAALLWFRHREFLVACWNDAKQEIVPPFVVGFGACETSKYPKFGAEELDLG